MGVPLGGIGGGTICRGWRGDFVRWTLVPAAIPSVSVVDVDQFSVSIKDLSGPKAGQRSSCVLHVPAKETTRKAEVHKRWNFNGLKVQWDLNTLQQTTGR